MATQSRPEDSAGGDRKRLPHRKEDNYKNFSALRREGKRRGGRSAGSEKIRGAGEKERRSSWEGGRKKHVDPGNRERNWFGNISMKIGPRSVPL